MSENTQTQRNERESLRLDPETKRMLLYLAQAFEGNKSLALRKLIRQAYYLEVARQSADRV